MACTGRRKRSYRDPGWWGASRHQGGDEFAEEGPAPPPGVVHELEEGEVERQLLLRDAAVRSQPGAQQRPDPSTVLTWTSRNPSPSSSRAHSPRAWHTVSWPYRTRRLSDTLRLS